MQGLAALVLIMIVAIPVIAILYLIGGAMWEEREKISGGCLLTIGAVAFLSFLGSTLVIVGGEDKEVPSARPIFIGGLIVIGIVIIMAIFRKVK